MPTKKDELHDDPISPTSDKSQWKRGSVLETSRERVAKLAATKEQVSMRLDRDLLDAYRELAQGGSYQQLIQHALRQWLEAQNLTAMVREELRNELGAFKRALDSSEEPPRSA